MLEIDVVRVVVAATVRGRARGVLRAALFAALAALAACGGGGDGGGGSSGSSGSGGSQPATFGAAFGLGSVDVAGVEGTPQQVPLSSTLSYTGASDSNLFLAAEIDSAVVLDVQGVISGNTLSMTLTLRGDLGVGSHPTELLLHACLDKACTKEPAGSPVHLPIHYTVKPNLQVQPQLVLARSGTDPAPDVTLPVSVPAEAGSVVLQVSNGRPDALAVSFDGSGLHVTTQQVRAGSYHATATLQSSSDARYARSVDITYTVVPPPSGEQALSVDPPYLNLTLQQGSRSLQHLTVTRPTWTSVWDTPQLVGDTAHAFTLIDQGGGLYDLAIDTSGLGLGSYSASVVFSAGASGGSTSVSATVSVSSAFFVDGALVHTLDAASTVAELHWSNPVLTFDGVPARWSAVSGSPLLQVLNASGQTGIDALQLALDPAALALPDWGLALPVEVSIDRPGTAPQTFQVSVLNNIPTLQVASPATLVGGSGRVYLGGAFSWFGANPLQPNRLRVDGATLAQAQLVADPRYVGDVLVLAIDLTGAVAGQSVTVALDSPLVPTQLRLPVQGPTRGATAYQALPYAAYRPGQFAPGLGAFYFTSPGLVYRWGGGAAGWSLTQAVVPGLVDAAPAPDDSRLYAIDAGHVIALDAQSLARQTSTALADSFFPTLAFDTGALAGARALVFSADGRALAAIADTQAADWHNVGTICSQPTTRMVEALTQTPVSCDPGSVKGMAFGPTGSGLVRSAGGGIVVGVNPNGTRSIYRADTRVWVQAPTMPAGIVTAAVSESGTRWVRSDGMLTDGSDRQLGNLGGVVPFTHLTGGYGISSGGRYGFVYGYRVTGSGSSQRAADATLWVLDLVDAATSGVAAAPVLATIALPDAVGCTGALVAGESCQHVASIAIAPGDATAFVLGPRGVVAVPLPGVVDSAQPASATQAHPTAAPVRRPLRGALIAR